MVLWEYLIIIPKHKTRLAVSKYPTNLLSVDVCCRVQQLLVRVVSIHSESPNWFWFSFGFLTLHSFGWFGFQSLPRVVSIASHPTNLDYAPRSQLCSTLCISVCVWLTIPSLSVTLFTLSFFLLYFCPLKIETHEPRSGCLVKEFK